MATCQSTCSRAWMNVLEMLLGMYFRRQSDSAPSTSHSPWSQISDRHGHHRTTKSLLRPLVRRREAVMRRRASPCDAPTFVRLLELVPRLQEIASRTHAMAFLLLLTVQNARQHGFPVIAREVNQYPSFNGLLGCHVSSHQASSRDRS